MMNWSEWETEDAKFERIYWRRIVLWIIAGALLAACAVYGIKKANAAPRVHTAEECSLVADMVLVASALQKNGISDEKRVAVMEDTYAAILASEGADRWRAIMAAAVKLVARDEFSKAVPSDLYSAVNQACQMSRGDLDSIFGSDA